MKQMVLATGVVRAFRRAWERVGAAGRVVAQASGGSAAALWFALLTSHPARADLIAEWGTEMFTWINTLDVDILPLAVTAGLLASLLAAAFSRLAGVGVFLFVVAGAFIYGTRDDLLSVAGGGGL